MKTFHIYTDASSKDTSMFKNGVKRTTKVGVIVVNSNIFDIYYRRKEKFIDSNQAEKQAILESVEYVKFRYKAKNIIVYTDAFTVKFSRKEKIYLNDIKILYIKGHCSNRSGLKYKFNCLADWISRNGTNTWRKYYYRHLLK
jgi:ribonuclease HI